MIEKLKLILSVNWIKTIYLNFKMLPVKEAKKLPIIIYGPIKLKNLSGKIKINSSNVRMGMIGLGQDFEIFTKKRGLSELSILGTLIFNGYFHASNDYMIYIAKKATCTFGNMSMLGSNVKIVCKISVTLGDWTNIGYDSQVSDSNYHPIKNTKTGDHFPMNTPIELGNYNYIANRVSINIGAKTPDNCIIASNSLINKDYTLLGNNILIGGIPAKLLKQNCARDYELEKEPLKKFLIKW